MKLDKNQEYIYNDIVKKYHDGQVRKYTGEPYHTHPLEVANIVSEYDVKFGIEIALLHDVIEDTELDVQGLLDLLLKKTTYKDIDCFYIVGSVYELTNQYTKENFRNINRAQRKILENIRIGKISDGSQDVKCADIIHNTLSIFDHDKKFASIYLEEKLNALSYMKGASKSLVNRCKKQLEQMIKQL